MIVQIDVDRFALLLDEWATAQTYGEDRDGSDDAAFIDANSSTIAVLLNRLVEARAAAAESGLWAMNGGRIERAYDLMTADGEHHGRIIWSGENWVVERESERGGDES